MEFRGSTKGPRSGTAAPMDHASAYHSSICASCDYVRIGASKETMHVFPSPSQRIGQILILFGRSTEPFGRHNKKSMLLSATAVRGHHAARVVKNLTSEIPSQLDHCTQQFLPRSNGRKTGSHWQDPSSPSTCIILHCTARCSARQNKSSAMVVCFLRYACPPSSEGCTTGILPSYIIPQNSQKASKSIPANSPNFNILLR